MKFETNMNKIVEKLEIEKKIDNELVEKIKYSYNKLDLSKIKKS